MKTIDKIENILREDPRYRDSDRQLLLRYWESQGLHLTSEQRYRFMRCTTAETITRARRALKHKYPPSEAVDDYRFRKFQQYKNEQAVSWLEED